MLKSKLNLSLMVSKGYSMRFHSRPVRFGRPRLLVVGCGDVGLRVKKQLGAHWLVRALTSSDERQGVLRRAGITALRGNLDRPSTLGRLAGLAPWVMHLAPPQPSGWKDQRTRALMQALARRSGPRALVYASTSGVYGNCDGAWVDETRPVHPQSDRADRRCDAESAVRDFGKRHGVRCALARIPGIYALDRQGGDPRDRLRRGQPVLASDQDVYTNHIHADDLARGLILALMKGQGQRVYNLSDRSDLKMGDYYDQVADLFDLPRPLRVPRDEMSAFVSPMQWSFMIESRRLIALRMERELRLTLRYPTVRQGLAAALAPPAAHPVSHQEPSPHQSTQMGKVGNA